MDVVSYQAGYADSRANKPSRYPVVSSAPAPAAPAAPAPTPAPPPPAVAAGVVVIHPTDNFNLILRTQKGPGKFQLVPGATYNWQYPLLTSAPYTLDGQGATVQFNTAAVGNPTTLFHFSQANTVVSNLHVQAIGTTNSGCVVFRSYAANCIVEGVTVSDGFDTAIFTDVNGVGNTFSNLAIGKTISVSAYITASGTKLSYVTAAGSEAETVFRVDLATNKVAPENVSIDHCTITTVGGTNLKGAMEWRVAGIGCSFTNNIVHDYMRVGQNAPAPGGGAGSIIGGITIQNNTWSNLPPTSVKNHLMLIAGVVAIVNQNDFIVDGTMQTASVAGPSSYTFTNNRRHPNAAGVTPRPDLYDKSTVPADVSIIDNGNIVVAYGTT